MADPAPPPRHPLSPPGVNAAAAGNREGKPTLLPSVAIGLLFRLYKFVLSPIVHALSPTQCLYLPTCSEYAYVALARFGPVRGTWLTLRRLARCHPFAKGGFDPVPESKAPPQPSIHDEHFPDHLS
ncbi:MAG TPA: membrane protein insertion efficiency factor YidD [Granulicella sp.]|jgi:putative membrane protein insertion efficiency factor|nr:membrane protein insertion efficiency factor YidD [Granulicella sp.]